LIICNTAEDIVHPLRFKSLIQTEAVGIPKYLGKQHKKKKKKTKKNKGRLKEVTGKTLETKVL